MLLHKSGVGGDESADAQDSVKEIADATEWPALLRALRIVGRANLRTGEGAAWLPFELAVIEAASPAEEPVVAAPAAAPAAAAAPQPPPSAERGQRPPAPPRPGPSPWDQPPPASPPVRDAGVRAPEPAIPIPEGARAVQDEEWSALVNPLRRHKGKKFVLGSLLLDCRQRYVEDSTLVLVFKNAANRDRLQEEMEHAPSKQAFTAAVSGALGGDLQLRLEAGEAAEQPNNAHGHLVRTAMSLGAKVIPEWEETE